MKKIFFIAFVILSTQFYAQTKTGTVTYEMTMPDNEEMSAMGTNTVKISFNEKSSATQIDMMGGMVSIKTISLDKNEKTPRVLMMMMDKKYEIIGDLNGFGNNNVSISLKNAESVTYDKKSTKEILGYKCYKAIVKMSNGTISNYYITESIASPNNTEDKVKLAGFPLEIEVNSEKGKVLMLATAFNKEISENCFTVPEGFKKVTTEELKEELGGF